MRRILTAAILAATGCLSSTAWGDTEAYWRHEEGPPGALIPAGPDTVLDSSGNGNHMQTFNPAFTSATYTPSVSPKPLRSGLPNTLSLDFGPGGDDAGQNDDNFTAGKPVQSVFPEAMTFEVAFNMNAIGGYQALFGKDGKPTPSPVPPLKFLIRGDDFPDAVPNQLFVEWIDGDGDINFVTTRQTTQAGIWYHAAMTLTATTAQLWVATNTGPYQLMDTINGDFAGGSGNVLISDPTSYTIGRGMFNSGVGDWANAKIDEVRISDVSLAPNEFLFVPEPASWALAAVAAACGRRLARRR